VHPSLQEHEVQEQSPMFAVCGIRSRSLVVWFVFQSWGLFDIVVLIKRRRTAGGWEEGRYLYYRKSKGGVAHVMAAEIVTPTNFTDQARDRERASNWRMLVPANW
jgi:hypothetical protein